MSRKDRKKSVVPPPAGQSEGAPPTMANPRYAVGLGAVIALSLCALIISIVTLLLVAFSSHGAPPHSSGPIPGTVRASRRNLTFVQPRPVPADYRIVPEHVRRMRRVVVSLATGETTLEFQHSLLSRLPGYTRIIVLLPESELQSVAAGLKGKAYETRVHLITYKTQPLTNRRLYFLSPSASKLLAVTAESVRHPQGTRWAQDLFEVAVGPGGDLILLAPCVYKIYCAVDRLSDLSVTSDIPYLDRLSPIGVKVRKLPLVFKGGNILVDVIDGRRVAVCGSDVVRSTRTIWQSFVETDTSDSKIIGMLKEVLGADEVVVVGGPRTQPGLLYHMDQAVVFLAGGIAGVTRIVGERPASGQEAVDLEEAELFLVELRSALRNIGYELVNVDTSARNLLDFQHYANCIPYVDAESGRRTLLMPVFSAPNRSDERLVAVNSATFESLGYEVIHVPSEAHELKGGIHCLINVLE